MDIEEVIDDITSNEYEVLPNFYLYFDPDTRVFSHSCSQPLKNEENFIEVGADADLGIEFVYTLDDENNIVKGDPISPSPME